MDTQSNNMQEDDNMMSDITDDFLFDFCDDRWMPYSLYPSHRYSGANTNTNIDLVYVAIIYNLFFIIVGIYYFLVIM